eukprot:COSAG06_NODE_6526_length_2893_cov_55.618110_2_plen_50_part_00
MNVDSFEHVNLASDPQHASTKSALYKALRAGWKAARPQVSVRGVKHAPK